MTAARRRLAGWAVLAVVLVTALAIGMVDQRESKTPAERAQAIAATVMCPTCDGQSAGDSDAAAARGVRTLIDDRIAEGASDDQIRDELADIYGEQILLTPRRSGLAGLVWALPVAVLVVALAGVALAFRRWRGAGTAPATDADRALVEQARATRAGEPA